MAASLDEGNVEKKFRQVIQSQESIQSLTLWVIHHKAQHEKIVEIWFRVLKKSKMSHRLTMLYLCNDIVQTCKRKHAIVYKDAYKDVLKDAVLLVRDNEVRGSVERIFNIWEERKIYDTEFLEELAAILNNTKVRATMNSKLLAEFKPQELISLIMKIKRHDDDIEIRTRQLSTLRLDASNLEAVKLLKDRAQGKEFCQQFEDSCTKLEMFLTDLEQGMKERAALIEMLEQSELYYDTQYGEAKIVTNAYKNFGTRVNNLRKRLEEHTSLLMDTSSPVPSPSMDAPSPGNTPPQPDEDILDSVDMDLDDEEVRRGAIPGVSGGQKSKRKGHAAPTSLIATGLVPPAPYYAAPSEPSPPVTLPFQPPPPGGPPLLPWSLPPPPPPPPANPAVEGAGTPVADEGSSTPVQDEKPDEANNSNPIDFLTKLINQSQKSGNVPSGPNASFFDSLSALSKKSDSAKPPEGEVDGAPLPPPAWEPWAPPPADGAAPSYVPDTTPTFSGGSEPYNPQQFTPDPSLTYSQPPAATEPYTVDSIQPPPPAEPYSMEQYPPPLGYPPPPPPQTYGTEQYPPPEHPAGFPQPPVTDPNGAPTVDGTAPYPPPFYSNPPQLEAPVDEFQPPAPEPWTAPPAAPPAAPFQSTPPVDSHNQPEPPLYMPPVTNPPPFTAAGNLPPFSTSNNVPFNPPNNTPPFSSAPPFPPVTSGPSDFMPPAPGFVPPQNPSPDHQPPPPMFVPPGGPALPGGPTPPDQPPFMPPTRPPDQQFNTPPTGPDQPFMPDQPFNMMPPSGPPQDLFGVQQSSGPPEFNMPPRPPMESNFNTPQASDPNNFNPGPPQPPNMFPGPPGNQDCPPFHQGPPGNPDGLPFNRDGMAPFKPGPQKKNPLDLEDDDPPFRTDLPGLPFRIVKRKISEGDFNRDVPAFNQRNTDGPGFNNDKTPFNNRGPPNSDGPPPFSRPRLGSQEGPRFQGPHSGTDNAPFKGSGDSPEVFRKGFIPDGFNRAPGEKKLELAESTPLKGILRKNTNLTTIPMDEKTEQEAGGDCALIPIIGQGRQPFPNGPPRPPSQPPTPQTPGTPSTKSSEDEDQLDFIEKLKRKKVALPAAPPKGILKNSGAGQRNLRSLAEAPDKTDSSMDIIPPKHDNSKPEQGPMPMELEQTSDQPPTGENESSIASIETVHRPDNSFERRRSFDNPHREAPFSPPFNDRRMRSPMPFEPRGPRFSPRRPPFERFGDSHNRPFPRRMAPPNRFDYRPRFPRY